MINLLILQITFFYLATTSSFHKLSTANDALDTSRGIKGYETLVSSGGRFELGFFSPGKNSKNWYIGIWYKNIPEKTTVWVANRENPVRNIAESALKIIEPGTLVVLDETNNTVWSSNTWTAVQKPIVQLLDSGNLVLRDANSDRAEDYLTSWRSNDDPAPGDFTQHLDVTGYPQGITKRGGVVTYRHGPWNGLGFSGITRMEIDPTLKYGLYSKNGTVFFRMDYIDRSVISRFTLSPTGVTQHWAWVDRTGTWAVYRRLPRDLCDSYKLCGAYGVCDVLNTPVCACLDGFVPRDPRGWARVDWSSGCVRRAPLSCSKGDGFLKYTDVKLPDARKSWHNESMTIKECKVECLNNCACMAYANLDIRGRGSGCIMWLGDLVDMRVLSTKGGQDLYVRVASSELGKKIPSIMHLMISGASRGGALHCREATISDFDTRA